MRSTTQKAMARLRRMDVEAVLSPGSQELGTHRSLLHGSWEISEAPRRVWYVAGIRGKAKSRKPRG